MNNANHPDYSNVPSNPDYDPDKDRNWVPLTNVDQTEASRVRTLELIAQAMALLNEAAAVSSELRGWIIPWERIGKHADATKALWHKVNDGPRPTGHDRFS